jgi:hypothetical protein
MADYPEVDYDEIEIAEPEEPKEANTDAHVPK